MQTSGHTVFFPGHTFAAPTVIARNCVDESYDLVGLDCSFFSIFVICRISGNYTVLSALVLLQIFLVTKKLWTCLPHMRVGLCAFIYSLFLSWA
jgi:hypothetical protein